MDNNSGKLFGCFARRYSHEMSFHSDRNATSGNPETRSVLQHSNIAEERSIYMENSFFSRSEIKIFFIRANLKQKLREEYSDVLSRS